MSVLPSSTSPGVMLAIPLTSRLTEIFWVEMVGAALSDTVTVAVVELLLSAPSVAVKVTVLAPRSSQVKLVMSKLSDTEQLSNEPLSTSSAVMLTSPFSSKNTSMS